MGFTIRSFAVVAVALVALQHNEVNGESCEEFVFKMMGEQTKLVVPCLKKLGYKTGKERKENLNCVLKCMFIEAGYIQIDGTADIDAAQKILDAKVPAELKEKANAAIGECAVHAAGLDNSEKDCASYGPLADCLIDFATSMCK